MRDVSPQNNSPVDFRALVNFLIEFAKNPIEKISVLPDWNWPSLFVVHLLLSVISGVLAGIVQRDFWSVSFGLFLMPIVSTISVLMLSMSLYYYFQFFESRTENFRKIFTLVVLSSIPFYLFQILSVYFSPITLLGFAFTSLLGVVGLCDNFRVARKRAYQIVGLVFAFVVVIWFSNK